MAGGGGGETAGRLGASIVRGQNGVRLLGVSGESDGEHLEPFIGETQAGALGNTASRFKVGGVRS
jgi:hypothetical protein